ncbi:hypothetical protein D9758_005548 [Tetrapyrgos nigripes]|uniref:C2H2-type domain-containing protein n=1 Tax=Tetrapyrgos nigripes TaxID=182062 RepID=A0A8H5GGS4_9AGAR|nr:hypothetical protein D9758_005548 [Tetrapyrgos nigripes]
MLPPSFPLTITFLLYLEEPTDDHTAFSTNFQTSTMPKLPSSGSKNGQAACKHNPMTGTHSTTPRTHTDTDEQSKPWACEDCGTRFMRSGDLRRHEKIHWSEEQKEALGAYDKHSSIRFRGATDHLRPVGNIAVMTAAIELYRNRTSELTNVASTSELVLSMQNLRADDPHIDSNPETDSISCPSCDYTTTDPSSLSRHRMRQHNYQPQPRNSRTQTSHVADTSQPQSQPESSSSANTPASSSPSNRSTLLESPTSTVDTSLPELDTSLSSSSSSFSSSYSPISPTSMRLPQPYSPYHSSKSSFSPSGSLNSYASPTPYGDASSTDSFVPRSLTPAASSREQCHNREYSPANERFPAYYQSPSSPSSSSFDSWSTAFTSSGASSLASRSLASRLRAQNHGSIPRRMSPIEPVEGSSGLRNFSHAAPPIAEIPYPIIRRPDDADANTSSSYGMRRAEGYRGHSWTRNAEPERIRLPPISTLFDIAERGTRDFAAGPSRPGRSYYRGGSSGSSSSSCYDVLHLLYRNTAMLYVDH